MSKWIVPRTAWGSQHLQILLNLCALLINYLTKRKTLNNLALNLVISGASMHVSDDVVRISMVDYVGVIFRGRSFNFVILILIVCYTCI